MIFLIFILDFRFLLVKYVPYPLTANVEISRITQIVIAHKINLQELLEKLFYHLKPNIIDVLEIPLK